jgi:hypothetical protein
VLLVLDALIPEGFSFGISASKAESTLEALRTQGLYEEEK